MKYEVKIATNAVKVLEKLPREYISKIYSKIILLGEEPRPNGCKKLKGHADLWRIQVGMYRIIYSIEDTIRIVRVSKIMHRKDIY